MESKLRKDTIDYSNKVYSKDFIFLETLLKKISNSREQQYTLEQVGGSCSSLVLKLCNENGSFYIKDTSKEDMGAQKIVNLLEGKSGNLYFMKNDNYILKIKRKFGGEYLQISKEVEGDTFEKLVKEGVNIYLTNEMIAELILLGMMDIGDMKDANFIQTKNGKQHFIDAGDRCGINFCASESENFSNTDDIDETLKNLFNKTQRKNIEKIFIDMLNKFLDNIELTDYNITKMIILFDYLKGNFFHKERSTSDFLEDLKKNYKDNWTKIEEKIEKKCEALTYWYSKLNKAGIFKEYLGYFETPKYLDSIISQNITITQPETVAVIYNGNKTYEQIDNILNTFDAEKMKQLLKNLRLYVNKNGKDTYFPFVDFVNNYYDTITKKIKPNELYKIIEDKIISKYNDNPIKMKFNEFEEIFNNKLSETLNKITISIIDYNLSKFYTKAGDNDNNLSTIKNILNTDKNINNKISTLKENLEKIQNGKKQIEFSKMMLDYIVFDRINNKVEELNTQGKEEEIKGIYDNLYSSQANLIDNTNDSKGKHLNDSGFLFYPITRRVEALKQAQAKLEEDIVKFAVNNKLIKRNEDFTTEDKVLCQCLSAVDDAKYKLTQKGKEKIFGANKL